MSLPTLFDRIQLTAARALTSLPNPLVSGLSGSRPIRRDGLRLDPEIQLLVALRRWRGSPPMHAMPLDELRQLMHRDAVAFRGPMAEVGSARNLEVRGATGPLRARLWLPRGVDAPPPLLLYLHGGGMVFGDLDTHESFCRLLCHHGQMAVLAVEYRLAPEHPFPAPLEDCLAAYGWARERAAGLGADPTKVAVGGDSAGGTLSAVIAWLARRDGLPPPLAQLLLYPATDLTRDSASMGLFAEGFLLTREDVRWFTRQYLAGADAADPRVSPLLASDHRGLAPALVVTSGFESSPGRRRGVRRSASKRGEPGRVPSDRGHGARLHHDGRPQRLGAPGVRRGRHPVPPSHPRPTLNRAILPHADRPLRPCPRASAPSPHRFADRALRRHPAGGCGLGALHPAGHRARPRRPPLQCLQRPRPLGHALHPQPGRHRCMVGRLGGVLVPEPERPRPGWAMRSRWPSPWPRTSSAICWSTWATFR